MNTYIFWVMSMFALMGGARCQQWYQTGNPHFLDTNNVFQAVKDPNAIKILKFFSPWCKYCRYIKAYVDKFKTTHQVSPNLKFYEFNCQSNGGMFCAQHFQVRAYPAVLMINQNGETVNRIDGLYPEDVIYNILDEFNRKAIQLNISLTQAQQAKPAQPVKQPQKQQPHQQIKKQQPAKLQNNQEKKQQNHVKQQAIAPQQKQVKKQQQITKPQIKQAKIEQLKHNQQVKQQARPQQTKTQQPAKNKQILIDTGAQQLGKRKNSETNMPAIKKQMVEQRSLEDFNKPNPSNPDEEKEFKDQRPKEEESTPFLKYILYLVGAAVGGAYAYRIWLNKQQQHQKNNLPNGFKPQTSKLSNRQGSKPTRTIGSRDIENQMLVEEVMDENL